MFIRKPWPRSWSIGRTPQGSDGSDSGDARRKAVYLGSTVSLRLTAQEKRRSPTLKGARLLVARRAKAGRNGAQGQP